MKKFLSSKLPSGQQEAPMKREVKSLKTDDGRVFFHPKEKIYLSRNHKRTRGTVTTSRFDFE
jgi:hypothetical protein